MLKIMDKQPTIRERVATIQNKVAKGTMFAPEATECLNTLSALYGNCLDEITKRELAYNEVLIHLLDTEKKANRAKIRAEISPEYQILKEAINTEKLVMQLIRSLNRFIDQKKEEMRVSKYQ